MQRLKVAFTAPRPSADVPPRSPLASAEPNVTFGTGFFASADGHILTNARLVDRCRSLTVSDASGSASQAQILATDVTNDLALLSADLKAPRNARLRIGVRLGEPVAAFGYPLRGVPRESGNFTLGSVTALSGPDHDVRYLQVSTPIQRGGSGGPLVDAGGNLIGVVSARLDALEATAATSGSIPENVNFAVRASVAATFLESNGVVFQTGDPGTALPTPDLANLAKTLSVSIACAGP